MNERQQWLFIRRALYSLKRQYDADVRVIQLQDTNTDYTTGRQTVDKAIHRVRRAIMLPEEMRRKVEQGIDLLSANKMFVSQGGFDTGVASFIFDARDLPSGFKFSLDDHIMVEADCFKVIEIDEFEFDSGWVIKAERVEGVQLTGSLTLGASNELLLTEEAQP